MLHAICHSTTDSKLPRDNILAKDKNQAEGAPEERKIVLGWELDTRRLLVRLPDHKYKAWTSELQYAIKQKNISEGKLLSILGRLENVATIMVPLGHFLNNIRQLQIQATEKQHTVRISRRAREDMKLALEFLTYVKEGVSMNTLTFREPTVTYIGDASKYGIGAYASHGRAWRWVIPPHLRGRAHINTLEFLQNLVSIWIDILEGAITEEDCILAIGDSTSAMGWLRRANFRETGETDLDWLVKQMIARQLARLLIKYKLPLFKQWLKGKYNWVADSLTRDAYYLPADTHSLFLSIIAPQQIPNNFEIKPVPKEIASFITSILQLLPVQKQRLSQPKPSDIARGNVGVLSYCLSESQQARTLKVSLSSRKTSSAPPLPKLSEKPPSLQEINKSWLLTQSQPPSHMWYRPSGQGTNRTPDWTQTVEYVSSSKNKRGATRTWTRRKRNKKQYRS